MKKEYKQLRKKLKNKFDKPRGKDYAIQGSVGMWFEQCGIKPTSKHLNIVCTIFGSVPYPYQEYDRTTIIRFLKHNKYKGYKNARPSK